MFNTVRFYYYLAMLPAGAFLLTSCDDKGTGSDDNKDQDSSAVSREVNKPLFEREGITISYF
ncbi:MAG: hypothetical protein M3Q97_05215, partial [Bacteroidota bacterium]|nr:hypothetical protein [Bacteroidota bacterium]